MSSRPPVPTDRGRENSQRQNPSCGMSAGRGQTSTVTLNTKQGPAQKLQEDSRKKNGVQPSAFWLSYTWMGPSAGGDQEYEPVDQTKDTSNACKDEERQQALPWQAEGGVGKHALNAGMLHKVSSKLETVTIMSCLMRSQTDSDLCPLEVQATQ
eukprot:5062202-Amphidinium_carterae.1